MTIRWKWGNSSSRRGIDSCLTVDTKWASDCWWVIKSCCHFFLFFVAIMGHRLYQTPLQEWDIDLDSPFLIHKVTFSLLWNKKGIYSVYTRTKHNLLIGWTNYYVYFWDTICFLKNLIILLTPSGDKIQYLYLINEHKQYFTLLFSLYNRRMKASWQDSIILSK